MKTKYLLTLVVATLVGCGQNNNINTANTTNDICCWQAPIIEYVSDTDYQVSDSIKQALAYMWNEEKLAKDLYLAFYALYPTNIFRNISTRSEVLHQISIENLLSKYNIDATAQDLQGDFSQERLDNLEAGKYSNLALQDLYVDLYTKGRSSVIAALQAGCVVEVTDIDDLEQYIAQSSDNSEVTTTYQFLKAGSYNHYWSFDSALKRYGVRDGCCSVGEVEGVNYCHNEYPRTSLGYNNVPPNNGRGGLGNQARF